MNEIELIDKTFNYLYSVKDNNYGMAHIGDLTTYIGYEAKGISIERLLENLYNLKFVTRSENRQATLGANRLVYDYSISTTGLHFIEDLPIEYKNTPYKYYLKIKAEKNIKEEKTGKYDFLNKKWLYKVRWWPFIISTIAVIISVAALVVAIKVYLLKR